MATIESGSGSTSTARNRGPGHFLSHSHCLQAAMPSATPLATPLQDSAGELALATSLAARSHLWHALCGQKVLQLLDHPTVLSYGAPHLGQCQLSPRSASPCRAFAAAFPMQCQDASPPFPWATVSLDLSNGH